MIRTVRKAVKNFSLRRLLNEGGNQGVPPPLPGLSELQLHTIEIKDRFLREKHLHLEEKLSPDDRHTVRRKRMIYRSKQRGWLEVDLLLGSFAALYCPTMTAQELDEYELILREETIDTFNYITGKDALPDHLKNNMMQRLQDYAKSSNINSPESYSSIKAKTNLI